MTRSLTLSVLALVASAVAHQTLWDEGMYCLGVRATNKRRPAETLHYQSILRILHFLCSLRAPAAPT